jgi:hypothetical protein
MNDIGTRAASTDVATACDVELDVSFDDDEPTHPVTSDTKTSALHMQLSSEWRWALPYHARSLTFNI